MTYQNHTLLRTLFIGLLALLALGTQPARAAWTDITAQVTPRPGGPYTDRIERLWGSNFHVENSSNETLAGPLRVVVTASNIPLSSGWGAPHGTADDGKPYYDISTDPNFSLAPGQDSPIVRLNFELQRLRLSYQVRIEQYRAPPPEPQLVLSASNLDFGTLQVGSSASLSFEVSNGGNADLVVSAVDLVGDGFSVSPQAPFTLVPGAPAQAIQVTFAPIVDGAHAATVTVNSNDGSADVALAGIGEPVPDPQLILSASNLDFGTVQVGSSASLAFEVSNGGDADLVVSTVDLAGDGFSVSPQGGFTLVPGAPAQTVEVTFSPTVDGAHAATVTVNSNDGSVDVALTGIGETSTNPAGPGVYFFHNDHLGTPQLLTDQAGTEVWRARYRPFGEAVVEEDPDGDGRAVTCDLRFAGQYFDAESGLHYNYFRYYDPGTGRYLTSDPIGLGGGLNTYGYAGANPLIYTDPRGDVFFVPIAVGVGLWIVGDIVLPSFQEPPPAGSGRVDRAGFPLDLSVVGSLGRAAYGVAGRFCATPRTVGYHATHPDVAPLIQQNGFRAGTAPGRLGSGGTYVNNTRQGAVAEFQHHNPGVTPTVLKVDYNPGINASTSVEPRNYVDNLPFHNVDSISAPSVRLPGTTNTNVFNGGVRVIE